MDKKDRPADRKTERQTDRQIGGQKDWGGGGKKRRREEEDREEEEKKKRKISFRKSLQAPPAIVGLLGGKASIKYDDGEQGEVRHGEGGVEVGEVLRAGQARL